VFVYKILLFMNNKKKGKLQITPLKFRGGWIWILPSEVWGIWILHPNILELEFYPPKV